MLTIQQKFELFHKNNPEVYTMLVSLALQAKAAGRNKIGIGMLFEVLRWNYIIRTSEDFKLNNNYRSRYVRLIAQNEPSLGGMFEMRELMAE